MSIETAIIAALGAIPELQLQAGGAAVYQDDFPQPEGKTSPHWPALRFTLAGGTVHEDICGDGDPETDDVRIQLDVVAVTTAERRLIWGKVRQAMKSIDPPAVLQGPPTMSRDSETKTYRAMGDWMIYGSSSQ